mgnify:CR=1 FL=1
MKKSLLLAALAGLTLVANAQQNAVNSPYSRYGLGQLSHRATGFNTAMAGTGIAMSDARQLNLTNPASLARIDSLSFLFDIGASVQWSNYSSAGGSQNTNGARFDYFAAGFRLAPGMGLSLGLAPYSQIGYDLTSTGAEISNGATGTVTPTLSYKGDGGLNEAYVALGYAPFKPLALGVNLGYLWGDITHTATTSFSDNAVQSSYRGYSTEVRSYKVDFGLQFAQKLHRNHLLQLGLTYGLGHQLNGTSYIYNESRQTNSTTSGTSVVGADTVSVRNAFALPQSLGAGLMWQWKNSLRIGVDYTYQRWSDATAPVLSQQGGVWQYTAQRGQYTDRSRISLGAEYVPNPEGLTWSSRVRYRFGASYATPYVRYNGQDGPRTYTVGLGLGLPILNSHNNRSMLNLSAEYVRVDPQVTGVLRENYFRLTLGLSFNERWFQKIKLQ